MATDSVYCYSLKNFVATFLVVLDGIFFILTGNDDIHKNLSLDPFHTCRY